MSQSSKLKVNLSHRLPDLINELSPLMNMKEAVDHSVWRSLAILRALSGFVLNEQKLDVDNLFWSIDAVINELQDIEIIIDTLAYAPEQKREEL